VSSARRKGPFCQSPEGMNKYRSLDPRRTCGMRSSLHRRGTPEAILCSGVRTLESRRWSSIMIIDLSWTSVIISWSLEEDYSRRNGRRER
jgi:hypothetical protein